MRNHKLTRTGLATLIVLAGGLLFGAPVVLAAGPPVVGTGGASLVTYDSAEVTGTVNPDEAETTYYFQYGNDTAYGKETPIENAGEGTTTTQATAALVGLTPDREYHYRIVASNDNGGTPQVVYGQDETFTTAATPPVAVTGEALEITPTTATITGSVNRESLQATYELDYNLEGYSGCDPENEPGHRVIYTSETTLGQSITAQFTSLLPASTYYYRTVVTTADGISCGAVRTFTTPGTPITITAVESTLPNLTAIAPVPATKERANTTGTTAKSLTNAQKLAKALKACKKKAKDTKRTLCEKQAHAKYGKHTKKKGKK